MIRIIKSTYGLRRNGNIEAMKPGSEAFELSKEREEELVKQGIAEYVEKPAVQVHEEVTEKETISEPTAELVSETAEEVVSENRNGKKHRR